MERKEIAAVLASAGVRPRHPFGQNFMVDQQLLRALVEAGQVAADDIVLEIGPGVGNLTRLLSDAARAVLAVDIDRQLLPAAQRHHAALSNVTWLNCDALAGKHQVEPAVLDALRALLSTHPGPPPGPLKLVSNLPYNAASPLIAELLVEMWREVTLNLKSQISNLKKLDPKMAFSRMVFTVQWEVGLRMACAPDSRDYGPLGILIQAMGEIEILRKIPPGAFWPPPKVHSALVLVTPQPDRMSAIPDAPALQALLAGVFAHRRQNLGNALKHHLGKAWRPELKRYFSAAGFDLLVRPETLSIADFLPLDSAVRSLPA